MKFTSEWYADRLAKERASKPQAEADDGPEAALHRYAIDYCRRNNIPVIHSRMDRAATCTVGAPDMVIIVKGRVLFIEFKTRTGKLSQEQTIWHYLAKENGHDVHVIRSKGEFDQIINTL